MVAVFLANVGVNSAHSATSPIFEDGTFRLMPIPERHPWQPPMLRIKDVECLAEHAPAGWRESAVHLDPDLTSDPPTYGDNCRRAGRAFSLRRARPGDTIAFLARLQPTRRPAGFYLVGRLEIEEVLTDVTSEPGPGWWDGNAHVRRARAIGAWDAFWVFKGSAASRLLGRAVPVGRSELETMFASELRWPPHRTELQTIGSYTRAVRCVKGAAGQWLQTICQS